jgi:hypothetical protein
MLESQWWCGVTDSGTDESSLPGPNSWSIVILQRSDTLRIIVANLSLKASGHSSNADTVSWIEIPQFHVCGTPAFVTALPDVPGGVLTLYLILEMKASSEQS